MKQIPVKEMTNDELLAYIRGIYGEDISTEYDKDCIEYLRVEMTKSKVTSIFAKYSKIKVTPKNAPAIYWPIGDISEELNLAYGLNLIKEMS